MVGILQPLGKQFPISNEDGTPTEYFIRWAQQRQIDIGDGITAAQAQQLIDDWAAARDINTTAPIAGGGPLSSDLTITHNDTAVTPGSYTNTNLTVDAKGHITAASNGSGGGSFRGALVTKNADQTGANYTTATAIVFDAEVYDTSAIHDNSTNNTRLTVPADVSRVRLGGGIRIANFTAGTWAILAVRKNGTDAYAGLARSIAEISTGGFLYLNIGGPVLSVTPGDYFELFLQSESDTSIDLSAADLWFAMEIVE